VLRALSRLLRRGSPNQLELVLETRPATPADLLAELRALGLPPRIERCRLTRNRTVMVSFSGPELRLHEGYLGAPAPVLEAVVTFVRARTGRGRARSSSATRSSGRPRPRGGRRGPAPRTPSCCVRWPSGTRATTPSTSAGGCGRSPCACRAA